MKIAVVGITEKGVLLGEKIASLLNEEGHETVLFCPLEHVYQTPKVKHKHINTTLKNTFSVLFSEYEGIVGVMSLGIIVRLISPLLESKFVDPAVVVVDELGQNVISTLSGHWGGANELTGRIADLLGANPVITTATDVNGLPAIDVVARKNGLIPEPVELVKIFNSKILNGKPVHIYTEIPLEISPNEIFIVHEIKGAEDHGDFVLKDFVCKIGQNERIVAVTNRIVENAEGKILFLRPRNVFAGIGCRKGVPVNAIKKAIFDACQGSGVSIKSLKSISSIELKKEEAGLLEAGKEMNLPVNFFNKDEINRMIVKNSEILSYSKNVEDRIGVGGVCEPVALLSAGEKAKLMLPKTIYGKVTVALAVGN